MSEVDFVRDPSLRENMRQHGYTQFSISELWDYTDHFSASSGSGCFGVVYKGKISGRADAHNGADIIIKQSHKVLDTYNVQWQNEFCIVCMVKDQPNIAQLIGMAETNEHFYLVYPFYGGGSLRDRLQSLNWNTTIKAMIGVARGLEILHTNKIVHADLKVDNVMLAEDDIPILIDFGGSLLVGETINLQTMDYADPESNGKAKLEFDIYSLGILMMQLMIKTPIIRDNNDSRGPLITNWIQGMRVNHQLIAHQLLMETGCNDTKANAIAEMALECVDMTIGHRPVIHDVYTRLLELE